MEGKELLLRYILYGLNYLNILAIMLCPFPPLNRPICNQWAAQIPIPNIQHMIVNKLLTESLIDRKYMLSFLQLFCSLSS